ncbi:DUF998 domain-containing protein [Lactococcus cremoris]|uniref:DUF998 domain-containing protein n=1 Tax=Lactococcus lactis subsp. cremoris TaxID=1359 RepID=UPI002A22E39F|nr:DUF998 domain-containing protein [Lactococcus lactis]
MTKNYLEIPDELFNKLSDYAQNDQLSIRLENQRILLENPDASHPNKQTLALHYFIVPSLLSGIVAMVIFLFAKHSQIAFTGSRHLSVASLSIILSSLLGFFGFLWIYLKKSCDLSKSKFKIFRESLTLSVAYTSIAFAVQIIFWYIIGKTFSGVTFDPFTAGFLVLVFVGIVLYFLISAAVSVTLSNLILLLFTTFIGGILVSMATNNQKDWWQHNFSFLGTGEATQRWQFNITLIFSALILLTITDFLFAEFSKSKLYNYKFKIIRIFYIIISILIAFVGIFPAQSWTMPIHNNSAFGLVGVVLLMIIFLKWLVPSISKEFLTLSWAALIALIVSAFAFMSIHYLSLTVFEIIAFAISFTWLVMFINSLRGVVQEESEWKVRLFQK